MTSLSTKLITGCGRTVTVGEMVQMYRDIVNISLPKAGRIQRLGENVYSLTNQFKTFDCDTLESVNTFKVYSLSTKTSEGSGNYIESVRCISDIHEVSETASATSDNGRYLAKIKSRDSVTPGGPKRQLLEIWDRSRLVKTIDTSDLQVHGSINVDSVFGNLVWCPFGEQDKLLYVCQPASPKHTSFFKEVSKNEVKDGNSLDNSSNPMNVNRGEAYNRKRDWGECLVGIEHTLIGILDVADQCRIRTINMEGFSLANPQWFDRGAKIVSEAYKEEPRLGLIYCNNRPSKIVIYECQASSDKQPFFELESAIESLHTPRVNHQSNKFVYLSNPMHGAHWHSVRLHLYDLETRSSKSLVDEKSELFIACIPPNCFTIDDKHILFADSDHLASHLSLYSFDTSKITKIKYPTTGVSILDFRHNLIMGVGSEIDATPTIFVAVLNSNDVDGAVGWHQIEDFTHLDEVKYETFEIPAEDGANFISGVLMEPYLKVLHQNEPESQDKVMDSYHLPTIVFVHGGPHSSYLQAYSATQVFYARLGFKSLIINYRGSTGVSEEYLQSLCGNVSEVDVNDCLLAIRHFVKSKKIDPTKLVIRGGSHGGFIAAHLSCNEEFKFTSAVLINPVIDMSSLRATSDIPDWCFTEALGHKHYDPSHVPTCEELTELYKRSPISKAPKAHVPTLMLLGKNDRRVNMYQGELWVDTLRARGVETLCKVYDDKHSLEKSLADHVITSAIWMLNHLLGTS